MRRYFYSDGHEKQGPFSLEELRNANIQKETLIWHEGLQEWERAEKIDELQEIFALIPPPLEHEEVKSYESPGKSFHDGLATFERKKQPMFSKAFSFEGRIRRLEYGLSIIIYFTFYIFALALVEDFPLVGLLFIPGIWFLWAQGAKRCHDIGNNGFYQLIPFYIIWLMFAKGDILKNEYGMNPNH